MANYFLKPGNGEEYARNYLKYVLLRIRSAVLAWRTEKFRRKAGRVDVENNRVSYQELFLTSTEKTMKAAGRFAAKGNQTKENLIHLNEDEIVGEWRDSTYGKQRFLC